MSSCTSEIPLLKRLQLLAVLCLGLTSVAYGRTITVERDGSGDFSTLQPALDACAAGDTVLIGPGTFEEMNNFYLPGNGGWVDIAGYVQVDKITIIGSGVDNTIIGQEVFTPVGEGPKGFVFLNLGTIEIQNLAIRNTFNGIFLVDSVPIIRNCQFSGNYIGIIWLSSGSGGGVFDSTFIGTDPINSRGLSILGNGQDMVISNCIFDASRPEIQSVNNLTMNGCEIFGSKLGMQVSFGATVMVSNCYFHSIGFIGINLPDNGGSCVVNDSEVSGGGYAVSGFSDTYLEARNSVFSGGSWSVFRLYGTQAADVKYCEIIRGSGDSSVICRQSENDGGVRHDFRGNYWGTEDGDQLATWILDGHDDPQIRAEVLYTPFATGNSDLVVSLAPQDSTIVIPETGGSFLYDASIENNTGTDIVADLTIEAVLPDGRAYPVMELPGVTLAGASVRTRIGIVQEVPAAAPAGTYTYRVSASLGDTLLVDTGELPFEKQGGAVASAGAMNWPVTGWLDEDRPPIQGGAVKPVLHGPVPNPFNPTTTVAFELTDQEAVSLHVFDLQGRLVRTLLSGEVVPQGRHEAVWDGRDVSGRQAASGTYFFRLEAGGQVETKRAVLVK